MDKVTLLVAFYGVVNVKTMSGKKLKTLYGVLMSTMQREPEPKSPQPESINQQMKNPLLDMLGANKDNRIFASSKEADRFLSELRNEWTH